VRPLARRLLRNRQWIEASSAPPKTPIPGTARCSPTCAYAGRADVVRLLIAAGADLAVLDNVFHGTPLSWATVGSGEQPRHAADGD
jgi:hypothetical protein